MSSRNEQRFVSAFLEFLRQKLRTGDVSDAESLEVAIQCLEASFGINPNDASLRSSVPLFSLFTSNSGLQGSSTERGPNEEEKARAEKLKNEGNELMKDGKFDEAIQKYSQALQLHRNPIFYCNRAAAYSKLERHQDSINDCQTALQLDPTYSKAYGRMGLAYSCVNKYREARDAYRQALELDPNNESFKNNLAIAEEKIREAGTGAGGGAGFPGAGMGGFGGMDFGSMLNNPALMNMASQVMSDPTMQAMMTNMMTGAVNQGGGPQNFGQLLEAGQRLANQMQQQNPELIEQLRRQFQGQGGGPGGNDPNNPQNRPPDQQPPPS